VHIVSCMIAIGGDIRTVVAREDITWPEVSMLRFIHGEAAVTDIEVVDEVERTPTAEKARLASIYDPKLVDSLYPGVVPLMESEVPGHESMLKANKPEMGGPSGVKPRSHHKAKKTDEHDDGDAGKPFDV